MKIIQLLVFMFSIITATSNQASAAALPKKSNIDTAALIGKVLASKEIRSYYHLKTPGREEVVVAADAIVRIMWHMVIW